MTVCGLRISRFDGFTLVPRYFDPGVLLVGSIKIERADDRNCDEMVPSK